MEEHVQIDFRAIYLSKHELSRFLEIANGDTTAKNTPAEDALFRAELVTERMMTFTDMSTGSTSVDMRAIVLSNRGKSYHAFYLNEKARAKKESIRYWITVLISLLGVLASIAAIFIPYILSMQE